MAREYCSVGVRGKPVGERQSRRLFRREMEKRGERVKSLSQLCKRSGWRRKRMPERAHESIVNRLGEP